MLDGITIDPKIHHGVPVISGTRLPVSRILGALSSGMTKEELMLEYDLTEKNIFDAMKYASELIESETVYPVFV